MISHLFEAEEYIPFVGTLKNVEETRFGKHFDFCGDWFSTHYGIFEGLLGVPPSLTENQNSPEGSILLLKKSLKSGKNFHKRRKFVRRKENSKRCRSLPM